MRERPSHGEPTAGDNVVDLSIKRKAVSSPDSSEAPVIDIRSRQVVEPPKPVRLEYARSWRSEQKRAMDDYDRYLSVLEREKFITINESDFDERLAVLGEVMDDIRLEFEDRGEDNAVELVGETLRLQQPLLGGHTILDAILESEDSREEVLCHVRGNHYVEAEDPE